MFEQSETFSFGLKLLSFVPFLSTWFIFTLIYMVVPNKKVSIKHSAAGALIAAIFFTLGKQAFTWYITTFPSYQLIYGAMATQMCIRDRVHTIALFKRFSRYSELSHYPLFVEDRKSVV